jgi:hypothetical protein
MSATVRYDVEWAVPKVVVAYLQSKLDAALQAVSPAITIFDPMAIEEENRFIVEVPRFTNQPEEPGCFGGICKVTVKSRWALPTAKADLDEHFDRTNWLRDVLLSRTLADDLNALSTGFAVDYVQPNPDHSTECREGWIYSDTEFRFNGHFIAE